MTEASVIPKLSGYEIPSTREKLPKNKVNWEIDPSRAALLIHDMQNYFLSFWGLESEFVKELVSKTKLLREACKAQGIPVFYTAQPINQSPKDRALVNDMWGPGIDRFQHLQPIHSEIAPDEKDTQLVKWRYSAFKRSPFQQMLKDQGRDQLIVCGIYAHIGCLSTGMDAFMEDIRPFFAADALGDFSQRQHEIALDMFAENCGPVLLTSDIINTLVDYDLRKIIASLMEGEEDENEWPEDDENLVDYGLDSVKIMGLAGRWKRIYPNVDFVALSQNPTIENWRKLLKTQA